MGPAAGLLRVKSRCRSYPPCNCKKSPTCRVVVALIVVSSPLIAAIIALAGTAGWDTEGNATISQRRKGARPTAGAAAVHRVPSWLESTVSRKWAFLLRHKGVQDHWIGLRREQGQPWTWANGTKFNHLFHLRGGGDCAYLNNEKGVSSSRCYMGRQWICSKPEVYVMVS
ncbi:unnamed protein product [Lepidochelys kempii]